MPSSVWWPLHFLSMTISLLHNRTSFVPWSCWIEILQSIQETLWVDGKFQMSASLYVSIGQNIFRRWPSRLGQSSLKGFFTVGHLLNYWPILGNPISHSWVVSTKTSGCMTFPYIALIACFFRRVRRYSVQLREVRYSLPGIRRVMSVNGPAH